MKIQFEVWILLVRLWIVILLLQQQEWVCIETIISHEKKRSIGELTFDISNPGNENKYEGEIHSFRNKEHRLNIQFTIQNILVALYIVFCFFYRLWYQTLNIN
jgi:hypothetical protein